MILHFRENIYLAIRSNEALLSSMRAAGGAQEEAKSAAAAVPIKGKHEQDLYSVLGVSSGKLADEAEIRRCYRKGALIYHPGTLFYLVCLVSCHFCLFKALTYLFPVVRVNTICTLTLSPD